MYQNSEKNRMAGGKFSGVRAGRSVAWWVHRMRCYRPKKDDSSKEEQVKLDAEVENGNQKIRGRSPGVEG